MQLSSVIDSALLTLKVKISVESDLCISSGNKNALLWRSCVLDVSGNAFIPGSQLKGLTRVRAEQLAELGGGVPCRGPAKMCDRSTKEVCAVCKLFGGRNLPSPLIFGDLRASGTLPTMIRQLAGCDAKTRKSRDERLIQVVPAGASFEGTIESRRALSASEERMLRRALAFVTQAGSRKSAGFGHVRITFEEAKQ